MKKNLMAVMMAAAMFSMAACGQNVSGGTIHEETSNDVTTQSEASENGTAAAEMTANETITEAPAGKMVVPAEGTVSLPSPIKDFDSLKEAEAFIGFDLHAPESISDYQEVSYSTVSDYILQVIYRNGDDQITIRKGSMGAEDISGDFNQYENIEDEVFGNQDVIVYSNEDGIHKLIWNEDIYGYSITSTKGLMEEEVLELVSEMMREDADTENYSDNTVIIMVEDSTDKDKVEQLCEENNLSILYAYDIIPGYALHTEKSLSDEEMKTLLNKLSEYDFVISAERDAIVTIDQAIEK